MINPLRLWVVRRVRQVEEFWFERKVGCDKGVVRTLLQFFFSHGIGQKNHFRDSNLFVTGDRIIVFFLSGIIGVLIVAGWVGSGFCTVEE